MKQPHFVIFYIIAQDVVFAKGIPVKKEVPLQQSEKMCIMDQKETGGIR